MVEASAMVGDACEGLRRLGDVRVHRGKTTGRLQMKEAGGGRGEDGGGGAHSRAAAETERVSRRERTQIAT